MNLATEGLLLAAVGAAAGTLNVIAGGGSFLTLPVLIFLGLPPSVANGTNRVGILAQNLAAVAAFRRRGVFVSGSLAWAAAPATAGAALGVWAALAVGEAAFQRILAGLMVVVLLWSLWGPRPGAGEGHEATSPWSPRTLAAGFFVVGVYGGFIQAGVGFFVLAVTSAGGYDLVRGNSVKVLAVLCLTLLSLALFAWQGRVEWWPGLALAVGTMAGGWLGARLTVLKGHRWVRAVVTATAVAFAIRLWLTSS